MSQNETLDDQENRERINRLHAKYTELNRQLTIENEKRIRAKYDSSDIPDYTWILWAVFWIIIITLTLVALRDLGILTL